MKKLLFLSLFVAMAMGSINAQNATESQNRISGPRIEFNDLVHNYGQIKKGGDGNCQFTFTNNGNEPLILSNVKASCGCTSPSWPKDPIMPGQSSTIKVHYDTNRLGGFTKTVTVTSNAADNPRLVLKIKGNVVQD